ncbi:MAG: WG repeat-containing protein [Bacteroidota bacterium]
MKKINVFFVLILFSTLTTYGQELTAFKNTKNLWGFKDKKGKVVVEPKYYYKPSAFTEGRSVFNKTYTLVGVLDEKGVEIVPPIYTSISDFKYGYALATKEKLDSSRMILGKPSRITFRGVLDKNGKEIVPVIYKDLYGDLSNGVFLRVVDTANKIFYYNSAGKTFTPPADLVLQNIRIDGKKITAIKNGKYGLVDNKFKELLPFEYSRIAATENGLFIAGQNNLHGLMDDKFNWIVQPTYKYMNLFQKGYAVFTNTENLQGAINTKGIVTTEPQFNNIYRIDKASGALAMYKNSGSDRSGLVDLATGKKITEADYMFSPYDYYDGIFVFRRDNKKGMIDSTGKELFYDAYDDFSPGFGYDRAWVKKDGKYGFIDKTGKLVIPIQYESIGGFVEGVAKVKINGKYGFIDPSGKIIIPAIYNDAQNFDAGMAWVKDAENRTFYIDKTGKEIK